MKNAPKRNEYGPCDRNTADFTFTGFEAIPLSATMAVLSRGGPKSVGNSSTGEGIRIKMKSFNAERCFPQAKEGARQ